jgi:glycosyltransferase involved in cell wall biosynthesis
MISVVIPTFNAGAHLPRALAPLVDGVVEGVVKDVIVSDGGSTDETLAIAEEAGCTIVSGPAGRGKQLRAGAATAKGKWLLFLRAETALARDWTQQVTQFLATRGAHLRAAAFTLAVEGDGAGTVALWADLRARWLRLPRGEQGMLISRFLYDALGGYADMPVMEDADFARRIGRERLVILTTHAAVRADTYSHGWRETAMLWRFIMGADAEDLARRYG